MDAYDNNRKVSNYITCLVLTTIILDLFSSQNPVAGPVLPQRRSSVVCCNATCSENVARQVTKLRRLCCGDRPPPDCTPSHPVCSKWRSLRWPQLGRTFQRLASGIDSVAPLYWRYRARFGGTNRTLLHGSFQKLRSDEQPDFRWPGQQRQTPVMRLARSESQCSALIFPGKWKRHGRKQTIQGEIDGLTPVQDRLGDVGREKCERWQSARIAPLPALPLGHSVMEPTAHPSAAQTTSSLAQQP